MNTLLKYFDNFLTVKKLETGEGWTKTLKVQRNLLAEFAAFKGVTDFALTELTRNWFTEYVSWRYEKKRHGINYTRKGVMILKQVLGDAEVEEGLEVSPTYKSKKINIKEVLTDAIALTLTDLKQIQEADLSEYKHIEKIRDVFILNCLTALRFSSWKIHRNQLVKDTEGAYLKVTNPKNPVTLTIPLHPIALKILEKYKFNVPLISNQRTNQYLKILGDLAGFKETVSLKKTQSGKVVQVVQPKSHFMTTHTARRTFVTLALTELDIPAAYVMQVTGHSNETQLYRYARLERHRSAKVVGEQLVKLEL